MTGKIDPSYIEALMTDSNINPRTNRFKGDGYHSEAHVRGDLEDKYDQIVNGGFGTNSMDGNKLEQSPSVTFGLLDSNKKKKPAKISRETLGDQYARKEDEQELNNHEVSTKNLAISPA